MTPYGLIEGQDYVLKSERIVREGRGTIARIDHALTLDTAKEIAMLPGAERGQQVRRYFIEAEISLRAV